MSERRFNEEEVSLILSRAMEADGSEAEGTPGLTLADLKQIAVEVGIDPGRVELVALTLHPEGSRKVNLLMGTPVAPRYELVLDGDMGPERYAELVGSIRTVMGRQGITTEEFGGLEWRARDPFGGRYVSVRTEDGKTRIRVLGNFRDGAFLSVAAGGSLGGFLTAGLLGATGAMAVLGGAALPVIALGALVPIRFIWNRWFRSEDAALRRVLSELATRVEAGPSTHPRRTLPGSSPPA